MSRVADLPRRLRDAATRDFQGEAIRWAARPSAWRAFVGSLPILLLAIPWTAFSLVWEGAALGGWLSGKPSPSAMHTFMGIVLPLFGLPFVLIGFAMLAAPYLAWREARQTVHVIGDRRLASIKVGRQLVVKSWPIADLARTERSERCDGSGTLTVVTGRRRCSDGDILETTLALHGIAEVRKVERLLLQTMDDRQRAS